MTDLPYLASRLYGTPLLIAELCSKLVYGVIEKGGVLC